MQQWLNDPKNRPIVYGAAGLVMVGAIVFILFQLQVIGGPAPYVPTVTTSPTTVPPQAGNPPGGPPAPGGPPPSTSAPQSVPGPGPASTAGAPPGSKMASGAGVPAASFPPKAGSSVSNVSISHAPAPSPASTASVPPPPAPAAPPVTPGAPPSAPGAAPAAAPAVVAALPNARKDPFAGFASLDSVLNPHYAKPRPDTFVPPLMITTYAPPVPSTVVVASQPNGNQQAAAVSPITLTGVMLGTGAYALVNNNGQSLVLSPGDQLPNGGGQVISIQSDNISVKLNGQIIKVPISSGDNASTSPNNGSGAPGPNGNS